MAPKVDAAPPAPTSLAGSERQGFAPGTCGRVLRGAGARWASDEFPKKGERGRRANKVSAERARNLPEEGGARWMRDWNSPRRGSALNALVMSLRRGNARDARLTSLLSGGGVSNRSRLANGSRLLVSRVQHRAASSNVAGDGSV